MGWVIKIYVYIYVCLHGVDGRAIAASMVRLEILPVSETILITKVSSPQGRHVCNALKRSKFKAHALTKVFPYLGQNGL